MGVRSVLFSRQSHSHINRKRFVELLPALVPLRARSIYKPYEVTRSSGGSERFTGKFTFIIRISHCHNFVLSVIRLVA